MRFGRRLWCERVLRAMAGTAAVGRDTADADPPAFDAVTITSSLLPTSERATAYDREVAPAIARQSRARLLQRRHW